jgi:predicted nucleic-acid-binding protein
MHEALVDANVLLRYLTDAPRDMADRAAAILELAERERASLVVAPLTLAEVVYVLQSVYHWERTEIAVRLIELVSASVLVFLEPEVVQQALRWYRDLHAVHFADAYIAAVAVARGHGNVVSFDRELHRMTGVSLLSDPTTFAAKLSED